MKRYLSFVILLVCGLQLSAQAQKAVLDPQQLLRDVQVLSADSMAGRLSGTEGNRMAQEYIEKRFNEIGLEAYNKSYRHTFRLEGRGFVVEKAVNLIGFIPGKTDKTIVLTAHYDHVGERKGEVFNGADDNASGVGGLLAAAAYFKKNKPYYTLVFAALDGEELGLQGANAFLEHPPLALELIQLNVNMDMLSLNEKGELYASGAYHYPALLPLLQQVKPRPKASLLTGHDRPEQGKNDWTRQSDHYQFHKRQIPFIYFGVEDHAHYHKPTDVYENINHTFYPDAAALVIDFVKLLNKKRPALLATDSETGA
ncbi:M28 family peptidase [Pontibacter ramchanderi]|uniref:Peptidase M28-like protein n=1 Tax=Pontibacter ramchanderi TaxID=1179743 RepID=A0A2N3V3J5_9BACT|nr:M28 family peptidase [Pontibacter ramchanderi]PKV76204.1 peptidase M28-like protein [Pontibacter ramchanderi]